MSRITTDADRIAFHLACETEGERTPAQSAEAEEVRALDDMMAESGIRRFIEVRDEGRFMQVKRLTTWQLKEMSAIERRCLLEWLTVQLKEFEEKHTLLSRHCMGLVETPEFLRANGAA